MWLQNRDSSTLNKQQAHKEFDAFVHAAARFQQTQMGNTQSSLETGPTKPRGSISPSGGSGIHQNRSSSFGAERKSLHLAAAANE